MNPNNGQTPLDYLNEISPQASAPKRFGLNLKTVIFGAIIAVLLVCILAVVASSIGSSSKVPWERLSARLATTQTIATDSTLKLKNSQLRSINSDLKLYLTNTQRDAATPIAALGINPAKLSSSVLAKEDPAPISTRLEDARLNAKFDSTYAREMSYQLATLLALYQELYSKAGKAETKEFLSAAYENLLPTQQALANFSSSTE